MAWIGPALAAGASLLGGIFKQSTDKQRIRRQEQVTDRRIAEQNAVTAARIAAAEKLTDRRLKTQMDFQERMANTAWVRGMRDMRAAGINPILAYKQGGAGSPGGASAAGQSVAGGFSPATTIPGVDLSERAVQSAMAYRRLNAEVSNMEETNRNLKAQNRLTNVQAAKTAWEAKIQQEMLATAKAAAQEGKTIEQIRKTWYGQAFDALRYFSRSIQGLGAATGR